MVDKDLKHKLVLVHGGLMVFAWLVAVPLAIGANMYARKKNKTWGTKVHMIVMATIAFLPFTISGIIAFTVAGKISFRPHSVVVQKQQITVRQILICIIIGHWNYIDYRSMDTSVNRCN